MDHRALPTFVIIGAQKCATRWLRINLGEHPQIFTAKSEMHFWNNGHRVEKLGFEWYRDQFEGWNGESIVGEATPGYMIWRHHPALVAKRIKDNQPDVRVIAILRNPVDRAQSALLHHIRRQRIPASSRLVEVVRERRPPETDWFCLVSGGWYASSLEPFAELFGDQLLVLFHDEVAVDPVRPFQAALRHVGADPDFTPEDLSRVVFSNQRGRAGRKNQLTADDRVEMWEYFREDVARLEGMLGVDLSRWTPGVTAAAAGD
jgi:Sulfotransferase domain